MENLNRKLTEKEPLLFVISGFSGSGKDAVVDEIRACKPSMHFIVTATTRPMRPGEKHGVDYYFLSESEFEEKIKAGGFIEYAQVYRYLKGVPKAETLSQMKEAFASGRDVIMRLDVQGSATMRQLFPGAVLIFIWASEEEVAERMRKRDPQGKLPDDFDDRMQKISEEARRIAEFDYVVHNRDGCFDETVDTIKSIIKAEHQRTRRRELTV